MSTWLDTRPVEEVRAAMQEIRTNPRGAEHLRYAGGDAAFAVWLWNVDRRMVRAVGVGIFDIADYLYRDAFDAGMSPKDAAIDALESDDLFAMIMGREA